MIGTQQYQQMYAQHAQQNRPGQTPASAVPAQFANDPNAKLWYQQNLLHGKSPQLATTEVQNKLDGQTAQQRTYSPLPTGAIGNGPGGFDPWNTQAPTYYNPGIGVSQNQPVISAQQNGPLSSAQQYYGNNPLNGAYNPNTGVDASAVKPQLGYGTMYGGLVDTRYSDGTERMYSPTPTDIDLASGQNENDRMIALYKSQQAKNKK